MIETPHHSSAISAVTTYQTSTAVQYQFSRPSLQSGYHHGRDTSDSLDSNANTKSSLDLTQRLERKLAEYNASDYFFKRWLFEIASWLVSALCMGTVVGIYVHINGREMVQSAQILNVANLLGKVASAALIIPTSEALGQLKWNWFHDSKAMWDFEIFDKASRGPWGAALLLFRTKGRSLAALGALLIVLLLAVDTFFQQVVSFPDRWALQNASSAIPRLAAYRPRYLPYFIQGEEQGQYEENLLPTTIKYLYGNGTTPVPFGNGTRPDIPLSCPTSSCTWPEYETLAVCSSCVEVSGLLNLTYACVNTTIDWSTNWTGPLRDVPYQNGTVCGYFLNATTSAPILLSGHVVNEGDNGNWTGEALLVRTVPLTDFDTRQPLYGVGSLAFKNIRNSLLDGLVASAVNGIDSVYRHEAPLVHDEKINSAYMNVSDDRIPWPWQYTEVKTGTDFVYTQNVQLQPQTPNPSRSDSTVFNTTYTVDNVTTSRTMVVWDDIFPSFYTAESISAEALLRYKNFRDGPSTRKLDFNPWQAPNNITRHMERLATAFTNVMRSNADSYEMLQGEAYSQEKFVSIHWAWLAFPLLLLALSLVFLVLTIIKTSNNSGVGIWKTSAMPALIYSLPKETQGQFTKSSTWSSAKDTKKLRIRLLPDMGWRVSGHSQLSMSPQLPRPAVQAPRGWI
ncbi:hypothetical protein EJ02DRAFT_414481 [Clathrospora elynae]|uniref:DUF3176 domain-containing protein n=1 Tax=Clathrospora elynae TaxID=706981 RepID=A0A6A5SCF7_9PLEO|nr:hypothetical protein EJ02DRAFT_414481 [Clathrospora elynae]